MFRTSWLVLGLVWISACAGTSQVSLNSNEGIQTQINSVKIFEPSSGNDCSVLLPYSQSVLVSLKKMPEGGGGPNVYLKISENADGSGEPKIFEESSISSFYTPSLDTSEVQLTQGIIGGCDCYVIKITGQISGDSSSLLLENEDIESTVSINSDGTFEMIFSVSSLDQVVSITTLDANGNLGEPQVLTLEVQ